MLFKPEQGHSTRVTVISLFCVMIALQSPAPATGQQFYCSRWNLGDSNNVTGFFAMQLLNNTATYSYSLQFVPTAGMLAQCPSLAQQRTGLKFHFHSLWTWGDFKTAAIGAECNASYLSGHYDPNLACGPQSTWASTSCQALSRTAPSYNYSCNPQRFLERPGTCEIGDLSAKFGQAVVEQTASGSDVMTVRSSKMYLVDELPPYAADFYLGNGTDLQGWSSIVFHCGDAAAARLFCSNVFVVSEWSECAPASVPPPPVVNEPCESSSDGGAEEDLTTSKDVVLGFTLTALSVLCIIVTHFHLKGKTLDDY
jgi:hypothetical protein